jgi:hypothetical protein
MTLHSESWYIWGAEKSDTIQYGKNSVASVRERTIQAEGTPFIGEVSANVLLIMGCYVASVTDPYGSNLGFLPEPLLFFQAAPRF